MSPDGKTYFSYDWTTKEYKTTPESSWDSFLDADPTRDTSLTAFKEYAEKYIRNNVAKDKDIVFERNYIDTTIEMENATMTKETINADTELENRIDSAFRISKTLYPEFAKLYEHDVPEDEFYNYTKADKKVYIEKVWETLKTEFDNNHVTQNEIRKDLLIIEDISGTKELLLNDFAALNIGRDAVLDGEISLSYIRPNAEEIQSGFEEGWKFDEFTRGYAIFQNPDLNIKGGFTPKFISKLDDMGIFESDGEAAAQWEKDTHGSLMKERVNMWIGDEDLEYYSYPDTPENRKIMKDNGWLLEQPLEFEFSEFTENDFNKIRDELFKDNPKEDYYGRVHIGSLHVEFVINQQDGWVDTNYYILGQTGEGETQFGVPYDHFPGQQFAANLFTDNTYEEFKEKAAKAILDDIAYETSIKPEAMRALIDWKDEQQCKELCRTKLVESAKLNEIVIAPYSDNKRDMEAVRDFISQVENVPANAILDDMVRAVIDNIGRVQDDKPGDFLKILKDGTVEHISAIGEIKKEPVEVLNIINLFAEDHAAMSEDGLSKLQKKDYEIVNALYEKAKEKELDMTSISQLSFIGDEEKMKDFPNISKEEFLSSYSYLSEDEYEATLNDFNKLNQSAVQSRFSDTIKTVEDINKVYDKNLDFIEQNISFKYSNPEYNEIDEIEKWKNGELYIPVADKNGNYTNEREASTLEEYNLYANKNFKSYAEVVEYQAGLKAKLFDSAIENCITEYLRREYAETSPYSAKFEVTVENQSYPIDKEGLDYIADTNEWGSANDRLNEVIDRRFEEEIEQKEIDIVSDILEYISQETNGNLVLKNNEISNVLFSDELVQIYAPKEEFLAIQPEETKAALIEAGIAKEDLYKNVETMTVSEKARDEMLSANFAGHGGLTQKAFADNGIEIDLETANALENCFSQIEAITKYTADGHDLFSKGNGIDTISEHSIEYSEETKSWFIHEKNWIALSAIKGDKAGPDDYMEKADRVGDRNWSISCELLVKYVYQEIKEDGEMEKEFPDTFKKLENLKDYTESLTEAKQLISDFCFDEYMSTPTFDNLKDVGLAYTTFEDPYTHEEYEVQTSADLINNKITTKVNDKIADSMEYDSLKDMVVNRLNNLDFDSLIYVPSLKLDELLKEERESVENTLLEKADQIIAETFNEPSLAKRAKLYVPSDYGYDADNKIHILVEFDNKAEREEDLFNALAEQHFVLPNGREVDFNPIKPEKSGTIEQYLDSLERIKKNHFQRRKEDKLGKVIVSKENFRDVFNEVIKLPKYKNKPLEAAGFCFSRVPTENKAEVAQWFSNLGCKTKIDTNNLFNKWNKENNPKPNVNKSKSREPDDWSISD